MNRLHDVPTYGVMANADRCCMVLVSVVITAGR